MAPHQGDDATKGCIPGVSEDRGQKRPQHLSVEPARDGAAPRWGGGLERCTAWVRAVRTAGTTRFQKTCVVLIFFLVILLLSLRTPGIVKTVKTVKTVKCQETGAGRRLMNNCGPKSDDPKSDDSKSDGSKSDDQVPLDWDEHIRNAGDEERNKAIDDLEEQVYQNKLKAIDDLKEKLRKSAVLKLDPQAIEDLKAKVDLYQERAKDKRKKREQKQERKGLEFAVDTTIADQAPKIDSSAGDQQNNQADDTMDFSALYVWSEFGSRRWKRQDIQVLIEKSRRCYSTVNDLSKRKEFLLSAHQYLTKSFDSEEFVKAIAKEASEPENRVAEKLLCCSFALAATMMDTKDDTAKTLVVTIMSGLPPNSDTMMQALAPSAVEAPPRPASAPAGKAPVSKALPAPKAPVAKFAAPTSKARVAKVDKWLLEDKNNARDARKIALRNKNKRKAELQIPGIGGTAEDKANKASKAPRH